MPDLTYAQLAKQVTDLGKTIARDTEAISAQAAAIAEEATDTARVAEMIGAVRVDQATVGETRELAKLMDGVTAAATAYAAAGDTTARTALAAQDQNKASHSGIGEAMGRSPVGREIYDVDREWLRQD
ncbi:hypothetical protein [Streptomyces sp. NPDC060001]|uniref:hypothetical protein n=1 Tax=Streptomyces sp. NPDC060001 TaxID=3347032 RepID=UPI00368E17FC